MANLPPPQAELHRRLRRRLLPQRHRRLRRHGGAGDRRLGPAHDPDEEPEQADGVTLRRPHGVGVLPEPGNNAPDEAPAAGAQDAERGDDGAGGGRRGRGGAGGGGSGGGGRDGGGRGVWGGGAELGDGGESEV